MLGMSFRTNKKKKIGKTDTSIRKITHLVKNRTRMVKNRKLRRFVMTLMGK